MQDDRAETCGTVEKRWFQPDGAVPNSPLPLLIYRAAFPGDNRRAEGQEEGEDLPGLMEKRFSGNGWTGVWRDGIYDFRHYHSTAHEVLGVARGSALLELGGQGGAEVEVRKGEVLVIPAGVSHRCLESRDGFLVVGAYASGREPDLLREKAGIPQEVMERIAALPVPETDPVQGKGGVLPECWSRRGPGGAEGGLNRPAG